MKLENNSDKARKESYGDNSPNKQKTALGVGVAVLLALLLLAVTIPLNLISERSNVRWDLSPNKIYELDPTTKEVCNNLQKDVYLYCLFDIDTLRTDTVAPRQFLPFYNIIQEYKQFEHIQVVSADPDQESGVAILQALELPSELYWTAGDTLVICDGLIKRVIGANTFYENEKDGTITINYENDVTSAVKYVANGVIPIVYFLTGNGQPSIDEYSTLQTNMTKSGYNMQALNLSAVDAVPDDAKLLLCVNPAEDFSDTDLKKVNTFLDKGGNIEFFLPPNESKEPYTNIRSILTNFAVGMNFDKVGETDLTRVAPADNSIFLAEFVKYQGKTQEYEGDEVDLTTQLIQTANADPENIISTFMPASRSFFGNTAQVSQTKGDIKIGNLLQTASTGYSQPFGGPYADTEYQYGNLSLACYAVDKNRNDATIMAYGADFINNQNASSAFYINPLSLFQISVTWIHETDTNLNVPLKVITYDMMTFKNQEQADNLILLMGIIPVAIAFIGFIVWYKRNTTRVNV
jgi:hypothetical protein